MPDPTLEFINKLNDDTQWVIRRDVPIFEPHKRGKDTVTDPELDEIINNIRALEDNKGYYGTLTGGHTLKPDEKGVLVPVTPSPKLYGFQKNAKRGKYGPKQIPCILIDEYLFPETAEEAKRQPHRSVEYNYAAKVIYGTSLMTNPPQLPMGIVCLNKESRLYSLEVGTMAEPMGERSAGLPDSDGDQGKKVTEEYKPEEKELFEKCRRYMCSTYSMHDNWPGEEKKEAGKEEEGEEKDSEHKVSPMQNDQVKLFEAQVNSLKEENARIRAEVSGIRAEREIEVCNTLLYQMELEGFQLTDDQKRKELGKLVKLPHNDRADRVAELRQIYASSIVPQGKIDLFEGPFETATDKADDPFGKPWYLEPATDLMMQNPGMRYEDAVKRVQANAGKK